MATWSHIQSRLRGVPLRIFVYKFPAPSYHPRLLQHTRHSTPYLQFLLSLFLPLNTQPTQTDPCYSIAHFNHEASHDGHGLAWPFFFHGKALLTHSIYLDLTKCN